MTMNIDDFAELEIAELEQLQHEMTAQRRKLKKSQMALVRTLDVKRAAAALKADVEALERKHGRRLKIVEPATIASAEVVPGPGIA